LSPTPLAIAALAVALFPCASAIAQDPGFVAGYLAEASGHLEQGELVPARAAVERALERDDHHLGALQLLGEIAVKQRDLDTAVHALHRWLDVFDSRPGNKDSKERKAMFERVLSYDAEAGSWQKLQLQYVSGLLDLGRQYRAHRDWLGALDIYQNLLQVAPDNQEATAAVKQIRSTGGREVAIEDVYAGGDPTTGMAEDEIAARDRAHATWPEAYEDKSENYKYRTDAGYLVLKTSAIAMEQMNRFYRRFFHFQEDGAKTPQIEIRIFKSRDEYLTLGRSPATWSGGQFTGDAVETYVGGVTGKDSIRGMYQTLFHEAAHQFVSMTGPSVPGWLNEAYASFFEGCVIMSNGSVRWNQAPAGRLFPLASRMEKGWMDAGEVVGGGDDNTEPARAPTFRTVVENKYQWGPPWYAPTWGVVYFLYNYRSKDGRPVWREALHNYYLSFKRGQPKDPVAHFETTVLKAPLSPVKTIGELDALWKDWILRLRDQETGKAEVGDELLRWAEAALTRKDKPAALEFLLDAREHRPNDVELLWRLASLLEDLKQKPQAAARYREFRRASELLSKTADNRYAEAGRKITQLDPLTQTYRQLKAKLGEQGLALARGYEERQLPMMALEIARRMTASFSIPEALEYYVALAGRTGVSLARWRVAYNERNLNGWSDSGDKSYQAYGKLLRAHVAADGERMVTQELTADVTFDADFSLAAEMHVEADAKGGFKGQLIGLCFGRKGTNSYHAVLLHPKGYMDISSNRGGDWTVHDHRSLPVGSDWHTLRIDVTDNNLDVYFDGLYVRSLGFADASAVRGGFGLICGPGDATFRNVRLLGRDPFDPAARIERELAMKKVMADASKRTPGSFAGFVSPEFGPLNWQQGAPVTLQALRDRPVLLAFWSPQQDQKIPCSDYLQHLQQRGGRLGLEVVVLCDPGTAPETLTAYLKEHPLAGARVAIDEEGGTYDAYFVKTGFFGMPRMLLLDKGGRVMFEGDPGLKAGRGWKAEDGPTFVDAALEKLLRS
jgi:tetratricopeptide (TPR) repeat protein